MENKRLPTNIIDKQFLNALGPMIFVQKLLLFPKFMITKGRVIPLVPKSYTSSFVGAVVFLLLRIYSLVSVMLVSKIFGKNSIALMSVNFIVGFFGTVFTYIVNITQSTNAVYMLIELQEAARCLNVQTTLSHNKFWNIINVACIFGGYVTYTGVFAIANPEFFTKGAFLVCHVVSVIFDLNIILPTRTVTLSAGTLEAWNRRITEVLSQQADDQESVKVMFSAYEKIIKAYNLCNKVYQFGIFYHTFQMFHHLLFSMQIFLEYCKTVSDQELKMYGLFRFVVYFAWTCKNFLLLVNVSAACERFYAGVRETETVSTRALAAGGDSGGIAVSRTCKNVLRLNRATLRRVTAYNLFTVDAGLPLRFVAAALAYLVVLLQFALL